MRILVVENSARVREVIVDGLREAGYETYEAGSAAEAIALLDQHAPDLLVADVELGGAVTGWDVAVRGREKNPLLGVIYVSGFAPDRSREVPGSRHLTKPFKAGQIISVATEIALERGL